MRDADVRAAVRRQLQGIYGQDSSTRIVEEMGIWSGTVRIDIAVINGELVGYELKSEKDTLERLPAQAELYSRIFDRVHLVVGVSHLEKAKALVPGWWGVTSAMQKEGDVILRIRRRAKQNPRVDYEMLARLLWKAEALAILQAHGKSKGIKSKPVAALHRELAQTLHSTDLSHEVRMALKVRTGWLGKAIGDEFKMAVEANLDPSLPAS